MHAPKKRNQDVVDEILRCLKGTPEKGLLFKKSDSHEIEKFAHTDLAVSIEDTKFTTGYCTKLWGNLVI